MTNARASAADSLRTVCSRPPGIATTAPGCTTARSHASVLVLEVKRELAALHAVDLERAMAMEQRWSPTRGDPDVERQDRAVALIARDPQRELVSADVDMRFVV